MKHLMRAYLGLRIVVAVFAALYAIALLLAYFEIIVVYPLRREEAIAGYTAKNGTRVMVVSDSFAMLLGYSVALAYRLPSEGVWLATYLDHDKIGKWRDIEIHEFKNMLVISRNKRCEAVLDMTSGDMWHQRNLFVYEKNALGESLISETDNARSALTMILPAEMATVSISTGTAAQWKS